jgi:hypothetical protein
MLFESSRSETDPVTAFDRRTLLKTLAGTLALPVIVGFSAEEVLALGLSAHRQKPRAPEPVAGVGLSAAQQSMLEAVTETLLPRTATPGATDARVVPFVDAMVRGWFPEDARQRYLLELARFDRRCRDQFGVDFVDASSEQRQQLLSAEEQDAVAARAGKNFNPNPGELSDACFFDVTKWLAVYGYFTSEAVLEGVLGHRNFYSRYDGDVTIPSAGA